MIELTPDEERELAVSGEITPDAFELEEELIGRLDRRRRIMSIEAGRLRNRRIARVVLGIQA